VYRPIDSYKTIWPGPPAVIVGQSEANSFQQRYKNSYVADDEESIHKAIDHWPYFYLKRTERSDCFTFDLIIFNSIIIVIYLFIKTRTN